MTHPHLTQRSYVRHRCHQTPPPSVYNHRSGGSIIAECRVSHQLGVWVTRPLPVLCAAAERFP